ncbi:MAG: septal ring lytic transglycosylase RlpA family protein [Chitinophagales bacterium]
MRSLITAYFALLTSVLYAQNFTPTGNASFYATKFEGRRTSNGEIFRHSKMTCAHRSLPFGTMLKVTNLNNDSSVIVRVNDRGPYGKGRVVDLTMAAAKKLDFVKAGVTKVYVEILADDTAVLSIISPRDSLLPLLKTETVDSSLHAYTIKVGSYGMYERVTSTLDALKENYNCETWMQLFRQNGIMVYRVFAGNFKHREGAEKFLEKLKDNYPEAYIVEID